MKKLLSLPPNLVNHFHAITGAAPDEWFCTSDPIGRKLGSGGGTTWLLEACHSHEAPNATFADWLGREKRILLHAGGQSRRLPAYAPSGKVLTPIPIFRWARGQQFNQTLLSLQVPLYERILEKAPLGLNTLIASGDVLLRTAGEIDDLPQADVVCYGLWAEPSLAQNHGVFLMDRRSPGTLDYMLQKPSTARLAELAATHFFLMDIGVWVLSDRAVELLRRRSTEGDTTIEYDLYGTFGCALGAHPTAPDAELAGLSVAIVSLPGGEFYHFGTSPELISSTTALQNLIKDQRLILQREIKRQPSVFTQNADIAFRFGDQHTDIWVENAHLPATWTLTRQNIVTGVPHNDWSLTLQPGQCVDIVPVGDTRLALRPYGFRDKFRGAVTSADTTFLGCPITAWLTDHGLTPDDIGGGVDIQAARLFPLTDDTAEAGTLLAWMLDEHPVVKGMAARYRNAERLSADALSDRANLVRLTEQRHAFRRHNLGQLAANYRKSVFYQADLKHTASLYHRYDLPLPAPLPTDAPLMTQMRDAMFRAEWRKSRGEDASADNERAFALLREGLTTTVSANGQRPHLDVCRDQIVWGRCPVRIDLAGGWTDTPPYSLTAGGNVVNLAIELNGQPPLQVYVKPSADRAIICRSIDLGAMERITTYEELTHYNKVGSPFSIPKAALSLAGFAPAFAAEPYPSLEAQLDAFGCGIEITLLSAIPAGSGLGTSSILAATVLGAVSDFCGLGWDRMQIGGRTLVLEQLLTTGGGWQDQYGGLLDGVKLLQTTGGFDQTPIVRWLPGTLFTSDDYKPCHLLYYTGLTRTAKNILTEIVRGMFLNSYSHLALLDTMKQHALALHDAIQKGDFQTYGQLVRRTWEQNKQLDSGTNPPAVDRLCALVDDLALGYKLPGAGGGGYLYIVAKDPVAAGRIRRLLREQPLTPSARFVDMTLSGTGLQVSRS